jgi:hypothetical protein
MTKIFPKSFNVLRVFGQAKDDNGGLDTGCFTDLGKLNLLLVVEF